MAVIASRKKQIRKTARKTTDNKDLKNSIRTATRKFNAAVLEENVEVSKQHLDASFKLLDKSVSKKVHNKNFVNRKKSRLHKAYNELSRS